MSTPAPSHAPRHSREVQALKKQRIDELVDTDVDLGRQDALGAYLRYCKDNLRGPYHKADRRARFGRFIYRFVTFLAIFSGTLALLAAIAQLTFPARPEAADLAPAIARLSIVPRPAWVQKAADLEIRFAAGAFLAVLVGLFLWNLESWLLWRYKAEHLRILKFHYLADPQVWGSGESSWKQNFQDDLVKLMARKREWLGTAAEKDPIVELPDRTDCTRVDATTLRLIADYYVQRRLGAQIAYFARASEPGGFFSLDHPRLVPVFFFGGVLCVLLHTIYERKHDEYTSLVFLSLAAALPAFWSGVRTWKSAHETARNRSRSHARLEALCSYAEAAVASREDAIALFAIIRNVENTLEIDQHEWLRLMTEAEWYG